MSKKGPRVPTHCTAAQWSAAHPTPTPNNIRELSDATLACWLLNKALTPRQYSKARRGRREIGRLIAKGRTALLAMCNRKLLEGMTKEELGA